MGLKIEMLVGAKTKGDGSIEAQCPACAATGGDTDERHLIVFPDGAYGCVAYQGDTVHNKEIYSIVGEKTQRAPVVVKVRKAAPNPPKNNAKEVLKKLRPTSTGKPGDLGAILQYYACVREEKTSDTVNTDTINSTIENTPSRSAIVEKRPPNPPTLEPPAVEAVAEKNGPDAVSPASPSVCDPDADPQWEISLHPTAPPIKIWRWKSGRISVTAVDWESPDGKPPRPVKFTIVASKADVLG